MIQGDLQRIFEYVEPDERNFLCYSFRIHELIVRTCIEIEANFKAILRENGYLKSGNLNINDYRKLEPTHRLSEYRVKIPEFINEDYVFCPYLGWTEWPNPAWHSAYNSAKHDRHKMFSLANFETFLNCTGALFVLLAAQFHTEDLSAGLDVLTVGKGRNDGFEPVAGGLFRVEFPTGWLADEKYNFEFSDISGEPSFFRNHDYR